MAGISLARVDGEGVDKLPSDLYIGLHNAQDQDTSDLEDNSLSAKMEIEKREFCNLVRPDLGNYSAAANLAQNEHIRQLLKEGKKVYHFGFGQAPFPLLHCAAEGLREHAEETAYLATQGIAELRKGISRFHSRHDDLDIDPDNIVVAPGSKELIFLLMSIFNGDILILSPAWTTYQPQSVLTHHRHFLIDSCAQRGWRVTPEAIEKVVNENDLKQNRLMIMCNPDNPTGVCYTKAQLHRISEVCRKHNIIVLSDEIYARTKFDGKHESIGKFYPEGTIISTGLSKWASAGGWRLGYHIFPPELKSLRDAVKSAATHSYSCAPAPIQYAAAKMFNHTEHCDDYISHTRRIYEAVAEHTYTELTSIGVKCVKPEGSFYMFPDFEILRPALNRRGIRTGAQMCAALLDEVAVTVFHAR
ncbi:uncharacterized protein LOC106165806 [Lingula anatina]|uniref:Uncharacterized protein LOC106165806 n=1 Tax=Lingula anatina TaxID=7574 RepID=A0A1S3INZ9_LINAN|nr:uncharacterized protein LOC106165806 [Lingula anatina]|eukprot:XP_013399621.1 uncharacterized protein LOC106165806 [Lingula anatina]